MGADQTALVCWQSCTNVVMPPTLKKWGGILVSACPYVCMYVCMYVFMFEISS